MSDGWIGLSAGNQHPPLLPALERHASDQGRNCGYPGQSSIVWNRNWSMELPQTVLARQGVGGLCGHRLRLYSFGVQSTVLRYKPLRIAAYSVGTSSGSGNLITIQRKSKLGRSTGDDRRRQRAG